VLFLKTDGTSVKGLPGSLSMEGVSDRGKSLPFNAAAVEAV
jgi:hypothetical protein